jgi:predicted RNase H-related nuclease YkuK (DUF458 family)
MDTINEVNWQFKTVDGDNIKSISDYVIDKMIHNPDGQIYIGCDSKVKDKATLYVLVIVIRYPGKGAHVVYATNRGAKFGKADMEQRLWTEVGYAVNLGLYLRDKMSYPIEVHIDISPHAKDRSNKLFKAATGWLSGTGLPHKEKPDAFAAMRAADMLTRHNRYQSN